MASLMRFVLQKIIDGFCYQLVHQSWQLLRTVECPVITLVFVTSVYRLRSSLM